VIKKICGHMCVFVTNRAIPATNNGSERALRPCVTFRKITNGFRTEWGAAPSDAVAVGRNQLAVGYVDTMGIARQVSQQCLRSTERARAVNEPLDLA
jgi:transposase